MLQMDTGTWSELQAYSENPRSPSLVKVDEIV